MKRYDVLSSPHLAASKLKKRKALFYKFLRFIILLAAVFLTLGFLLRLEKINIQNTNIEGNKVADERELEQLVKDAIAGDYLWLLPKSNILFYSKDDIEKKLRAEFKILNDISITIEKDRALLVSVSERSPVYTWCGEELPAKLEKTETVDCYFMDDSGYVFARAPYFSGDVYFRFFGSLESGQITGSYFMPEVFTSLASFIKALKQMGLKPVSLLDKGEKIELYLSSGSNPPAGPKIILNRDSNFEKSAENLQAALSTEPLMSEFKEKYSSLQYLNITSDTKVYYKFSE